MVKVVCKDKILIFFQNHTPPHWYPKIERVVFSFPICRNPGEGHIFSQFHFPSVVDGGAVTLSGDISFSPFLSPLPLLWISVIVFPAFAQ
jgi:hypothetical protein